MTISLLFKDALSKKNSGKLQEAEKILEKILLISPNNIDAIINLGLINVKYKKFEKSILLFQKAIKLDSYKLDPYINLGNIYTIKKNYLNAIDIFKKANSLSKNNENILNNLSYLYNEIEDYSSAQTIINKSLKFNPNNYFTLNILGTILLKFEKIDQGINILIKSININNEYIYSYLNLFSILEQTNKIDLLKKYIDKAEKYFINNKSILVFKSLYFLRIKEYKKCLDILSANNFYDSIKNSENLLIKYHDILGRVYDQNNRAKKAFINFQKRNLITKKKINQRYDKKIIIDVIKTYSIFFNKNNNKNVILDSFNDFYHDPIFLVGFPRSGTTLLDTILSANTNTIVFEEKPIVSNLRDNYFKLNNNLIDSLDNVTNSDIINLRAKYFKIAQNYSDENFLNKIIIDKQPLNMIEVGFINKIFPKSKFIMMLRHPYDTILSCFMADFKINEAMTNFFTLEDSAIFYNEVFLLWKVYIQKLNIDYYDIKYENLVLNFEPTIKELLNFIELEWQPEMVNFHTKALSIKKINTASYYQVIETLYDKSINRWKKYKEIENIVPLITKWIKEYNYDQKL